MIASSPANAENDTWKEFFGMRTAAAVLAICGIFKKLLFCGFTVNCLDCHDC